MADNTNEFKILLGVELKSDVANDINSQLRNLRINPIDLQVGTIDASRSIDRIRRQIESLNNIRVNINIGNGGFGGGNGGQRVANDVTRAYRELSSLQTRLSSKMQRLDKIDSIDTTRSQQEVVELTTQINNLYTRYQGLYALFSNRLSGGQLDSLNRGFDVLSEKLNLINSQTRDMQANLARTVTDNFANGKFNLDNNNIQKQLSTIRTQTQDVTNAVNNFNVAYEGLNNAINTGNVADIITANQQYEDALERVNNQIKSQIDLEKQQSNARKQSAEQIKLNDRKTALDSRIDLTLKNYSAAARQFGKDLEDLRSRIQACNKEDLDHLESELDQYIAKIKLAGKDTQTFWDKIKTKLNEHGIYLAASTMFAYAVQSIREMYDNVIELDTAMTDLKKVTDETDVSYQRFLDNAGKKAQGLGRSVSSYVQQTANWAKMGFDVNESSVLAEVSSVYANVADVDDATAVSDIVTALKAFNIEAEHAITIVDPLNKLSNEFAVTAAGLGQGLSRAASTMSTAGTDMEHTLALLTGIAEITQSPEEAGNFLKTAVARIQGMKGTLEELGEEVDESVDSISKVQTQILNLTHGKVNIFDDNGQFRDYYNIMKDIAGIVDNLKSTERAQLYEILFGKNRMNQGAAMLQAFQSGRIGEALNAALKADGSAYAEQAKWMESLEAKLGKLEAAFESLSETVLGSDLISSGIDAITLFVNALDKVVDTLGTLGTLGTGIALFNIFKNKDLIKNVWSFSKAFLGAKTSFDDLMISSDNLTASFKSFMKTPAGVAAAVGLVTTAINIAIQAYKNYRKELIENAQTSLDNANAQIDNIDAYEKAYVIASKYADKIELSEEENSELKSAIGDVSTALGMQSGSFDTVNGSAQDYLETLQNINKETLQGNVDSAKQGLKDARTLLSDTADPHWLGASVSGNKISVQLNEEMTGVDTHVRALEIVNEAMSDYIDIGTHCQEIEPINFDNLEYGSEEYTDALVDYYYQLLNLRDVLSRDDLAIESDIYQSVNDTIVLLSGSVSQYVEQKKELLSAEYELANGIPSTIDEYLAMRKAILDNVDANNQYKDAIGGLLDAEWGNIFDLDSYYAAERKIEAIREKFKSFVDTQDYRGRHIQTDMFDEWLNSLSPEDLEIVYTISLNPDSANLALQDWQNALENYTPTIPEDKKISYSDLFSDDDDFKTKVDEYVEQTEKLKEALDSIREGEFTTKDRYELESLFPQLAGSDNFEKEIESLIKKLTGYRSVIDKTGKVTTKATGIMSVFEDAFGRVDSDDDKQKLEAFMNTVLELGQVVGNTAFSIDIDVESDKMKNLYNAINESVSGTGLSTDAIKNIEELYSGLSSYDPSKLFEQTEHGIHLNVQALRELNSEYELNKKIDLQEDLKDLKQEYNNAQNKLKGLTKGTDEYNQQLLAIDGIEGQISDVQTLIAQYEGLTSAYNKWIEAQSTKDENDMYLNLSDSIEAAKKLYEEGWIGTDDFRSWVQMMTDEDLSAAPIEKILEVYEKGMPAMEKFFTGNTDGLLNFLNLGKEVSEQLGEDFITLGEDGKWHIDFEGIGDEEFAKAFSEITGLQISAEQLQILLRALSAAGFDVNLESAYASVEELQSRVEETESTLKKMGEEPVNIDIYCSVESAETELEKAKAKIEEIKNDNTISIEVKEALLADAYAKVDALVARINQPAFMSINVSEVDTELQGALALLQNYQTEVNNLKALEIKGADTSEIEEAKKKVDEYATAVNGLPEDVKTQIGITTENIDTESLNKLIVDNKITIPVSIGGIDNQTGNESVITIEAKLGDSFDSVGQYISAINNHVSTITVEAELGDSFDDVGEAVSGINEHVSTITVEAELGDSFDDVGEKIQGINDTVSTITVEAELGNTFDVVGEAIRGIENTTATITVEAELGSSFDSINGNVVGGNAGANGTAYARGSWGTKGSGVALGGEEGTEIVVRDGRWFTIGDNGAEFFNYKKNDIIFNADQSRQLLENGKITSGLKRGRAFAEGTAFAVGSDAGGTIHVNGNVTTKPSKGGSGKGSGDSAKEFLETFDWIEIAIDRIERAISRLDTKANSTYRSWSSRNNNLKKEISKVGEEIDLQQQAYDRYIQQANSVGLSESWAKKVRDGKVDIEDITDEKLAEKIGEYQTWYEKAIDCKDAIVELEESQSQLYETAFNNIVTQYDGFLSVVEHERSMLEEYISQSEASGHVVSTKYYDALINVEKANIEKLEKEKDALLTSLEEAVNSGTIKPDSEAWYFIMPLYLATGGGILFNC